MPDDWFPADDARVAQIAGFVGSVKGQRVLEVGMKYGFTLQCLDSDFKVGLDPVRKYVRASTLEMKLLGDVFALPFPDNSLDMTLFTEVIEHIDNPKKALDELSRVSKRIVISTPNNSWARKVKHRILGKGHLIAQNHVREYSLKELARIAGESGLYVSRVRGLGFFVTYRLQGLMNVLGRMIPSLSADVLLELRHT